jgi:hypothetical protein
MWQTLPAGGQEDDITVLKLVFAPALEAAQ